MPAAIVVSELGFSWPDGRVLFDRLSFALGPGRTGLFGANGSGKSTLLRLVAGDLVPTRGSIHVAGAVGYLRQDLTLDATLPVDAVLGIDRVRRALRAIESGDAAEEHFAAVGDGWDVEERAAATLDRLGLGRLHLDRRVGEVSGGEAVLLGLAAQFLGRPDVLLLDEPTNNLDLAARRRLYDAVLTWPGVLVVVSHDRALLDLVDQIGELRDGGARWFGGNLTAYEEAVEIEQEAARRMVRAAESELKRQQRDLIQARIELDRRVKKGKKAFENARAPRAVMRDRKRTAQVSAGKYRNLHLERVEEARGQLAEVEEAVRDDPEIRVDLPATRVPAGRTVLLARGAVLRGGAEVDLEVRGPERIALLGGNGTGKTTLFETITGALAPVAGTVTPLVPLRYLPQRLDVLDDADTIVDNVRRFAPGVPPGVIRGRLARFLFRGDLADQAVGTLSGGERFRATLAALLLAEPAPQLLLLDEPTNSLDLASVRELAQALAAYQGALIVASHDLPFLRSIGATRWVRLAGRLTEIDPP